MSCCSGLFLAHQSFSSALHVRKSEWDWDVLENKWDWLWGKDLHGVATVLKNTEVGGGRCHDFVLKLYLVLNNIWWILIYIVGRTLIGSHGNNFFAVVSSSVETFTRPSHCDTISQVNCSFSSETLCWYIIVCSWMSACLERYVEKKVLPPCVLWTVCGSLIACSDFFTFQS
jgi:large subunit ribosomal protein L14